MSSRAQPAPDPRLGHKWSRACGSILVRHPAAVVTSCGCLLLLVAVAVLLSTSRVISNMSTEQWEDKSEASAVARDAWEYLEAHTPSPQLNKSDTGVALATFGLTLMYSHAVPQAGSILTVAKLQAMCSVENAVLEHPAYRDVCVLDTNSTGKCAPHWSSIAGLFYGKQRYDPEVGYAGRDCSFWLPGVRVVPSHCLYSVTTKCTRPC